MARRLAFLVPLLLPCGLFADVNSLLTQASVSNFSTSGPCAVSSTGSSFASAGIPAPAFGCGGNYGTAAASAGYGYLKDNVTGFSGESLERSIAIANFTDQVTITGAETGLGSLQTTWLLSYSIIPNGEACAGPISFQFGSQNLTVLQETCFIPITETPVSFAELIITNPLAFTFGQPFSISAALASTGLPKEGYIDFDQSTAELVGVNVFQGSTAVTDFQIQAASGTTYPLVPELNSLFLLATALSLCWIVRVYRRAERTSGPSINTCLPCGDRNS
jgi:hypothetical protein